MSASEHAEKARTYLHQTDNRADAWAARMLTRAQVEATLAIAEALLELKDEGIAQRMLPIGPR